VSVKTFNSTTARRYQSSTPSSDSGTESSQDLQLPDITNYYTLFPRTLPAGPPPSGPFEISLSDLRREFLQLQSLHHPDKYTSSATAQRKSLALSSLLNTAYKTLSDPLLRARYLLHHNYGVDVTTEDNNTHRASTDQATLMEVMEAQEAIEEARTQEQIDQLKTENQARIDDAVKSLGEAFKHEDIEVAKTECIGLNYWRSLQQGLHDWEPGKEIRLIH
jgi:molecular chaperone HscB